MTWFTVETRYTDDADLLAAVRPAHREYLGRLVSEERVLAGGPLADGSGGFVVFRVGDRAELDDLLLIDPYTTEGVAVDRVVREWNIVVGPWAG
ncbi:MAG: YciI family protein [Actinomycetota bacterium]|nr:YciI family protein [Actinomycetota bacterium]